MEPVILLDTPAPLQDAEIELDRLLIWFLDELQLDIPTATLPQNLLIQVGADAQLDWAMTYLAERGLWPVGLGRAAIARAFAVFSAVVLASRTYSPRRLAGPAKLVVIRAAHGVVPEFHTHPARGSADWGWSKFGYHVATHEVEATHYTLLQPPFLDEVARLIDLALGDKSSSAPATTGP